jgi:cell division protein FtsL
MTQATDQDIRDINDSIKSTNKAISDLTASVSGLREELRVGFANVDTKFAEVRGEIKALDTKLEERTRLGFWGFVFRAVMISVLTGTLLLFLKYLFPIIPSA